MTTHLIQLRITDEEIEALREMEGVLNNVAEMGDLNDDYADEVEKINDLYAHLTGINSRIQIGVLAS
jgi:hypothetical protein